ncbi:MAG: glutaredoxin family protein [Methylococcaceae bacterium]|nr:glutaredoxin family protein [Methylococcaceae bacterium]
MNKLMLFGTQGCHLCEEAELIIATCKLDQFEVERVDIAEHEQWQDKYAIRIPVLYHPQTKKELGWPFTEPDVQALINRLSND